MGVAHCSNPLEFQAYVGAVYMLESHLNLGIEAFGLLGTGNIWKLQAVDKRCRRWMKVGHGCGRAWLASRGIMPFPVDPSPKNLERMTMV